MLSNNLGAEISVGGVDIAFLNNIILEDVYIGDQHNDTLLFVKELKAGIKKLSFKERKLKLSNVTLNWSDINVSLDSSRILNLQFIIKALKSENQDTTKKKWSILCNEVNIFNSNFTYKSYYEKKKEFGVNYSHISVSNINLSVDDLVIKDSLYFKIKHLSCTEKSGFLLNDFKADITIGKKIFYFDNLNIVTPHSNVVAGFFNMDFNSFKEFKDYNNKVKIKSFFAPSVISFEDIAYFSPSTRGMKQKAIISGKITGKIKNLKIKNIDIFFGSNTHINGSFSMDGLPNIENTFIYADIKSLITNKKDLEQITIPPFKEQKYLKLPDNFKTLGNIKYNGNFTGFLKDFVAYGDFSTQLGNFSSDISLKKVPNSDKLNFKGNLESHNFNFGKLLNLEKHVGAISLNVNLNGYTSPTTRIDALMSGIINSVEIEGYKYNSIKIEGNFSEKKFDGLLYINDPNILMSFLGRFDFTQLVPTFDFTADIQNADLHKLNINKRDSVSNLSMLLKANFIGDNPDNIDGSINLFNTTYKIQNKEIYFDELYLSSVKNNSSKTLTLKSDLADATINGNYRFTSLVNSFKNYIYHYLPSFKKDNFEAETDHHNNFNFNVHFKKTRTFSDIFLKSLYTAPNTVISGNFSSRNNTLEVDFSAAELECYGVKFNDLNLKINPDTLSNEIIVHSECSQVIIDKNLNLHNFSFNTKIENDSIDFNLLWNNEDTVEYKGDIMATASFIKKDSGQTPVINLEFIPSYVIIGDSLWNINSSKIMVDSNQVEFTNLILNHNNQLLHLNGKISDNKEDSLSIIFNNFDLSNFNIFTKNKGVEFEGSLNGESQLSDYYHNTFFYSDMTIDGLVINKEKLGKFYFTSNWDKQNKKIHVSAYSQKGKLKILQAEGDYFSTSNSIDFDVSLNKMQLTPFETIFKKRISDLRGMGTGKIKVTGKPKTPIFNGKVKLEKTSFTIDYLQTRYNFTSYINIKPNSFEFKDVKILNSEGLGDYAIANGTITHQNFKNTNFNISVDAKNFLFLDTKEKDNNLYYGRAFGTGVINVTGPINKIKIDISAKTEKNTKFFIPLYGTEEVAENDFITFVSSQKTSIETEEEYNVDLSGIELNIDLEVTPDAEAQLIFDPTVGDIIKGNGNANLKMEINTLGDFHMYGDYIIEDGDYLFTLSNIINKRFDIQKGGVIKWNGDPYDAYINLEAIYRTKASLHNLMKYSFEDDSLRYKQRVSLECLLKMTNRLMSPDIEFGINVPNADSKVESVINNLSENELNKQILSLLVINSFYTSTEAGGLEPNQQINPVGVTSSELLSNQLSHWLSQISNTWDIGFNYRPGDEISTDEVELALSTQLLNDRVLINSNFGMGGQQNNQLSGETPNNASAIVGDVSVEVKIHKSGKLRVKGYSRSNNDFYTTAPYTQGLGLFYREEFDTWGALMNKYWKIVFKKEEELEPRAKNQDNRT